MRFVRWKEGKPVLSVDKGLCPHLYPHVRQVNAKIDDQLPPPVKDALVRSTDQWLMIAEREITFSYDTLRKMLGGPEEVVNMKGGIWQQALSKHLDNFFNEMLEAGVFQPDEKEEGSYRFNSKFSLGWSRQIYTFSFPEALREFSTGLTAPETGYKQVSPFEAPPQIAYFVNREEELRAIRQALDTSTSLIQIVGMAGIGKTALAVQVAHEMRNRFPDGVLWITMEPSISFKNVLHHIALSYGRNLAASTSCSGTFTSRYQKGAACARLR